MVAALAVIANGRDVRDGGDQSRARSTWRSALLDGADRRVRRRQAASERGRCFSSLPRARPSRNRITASGLHVVPANRLTTDLPWQRAMVDAATRTIQSRLDQAPIAFRLLPA